MRTRNSYQFPISDRTRLAVDRDNVVRCTRLFCGREELETIVILHSLVSEGQGRSGKVMRVTGMKWMSGL